MGLFCFPVKSLSLTSSPDANRLQMSRKSYHVLILFVLSLNLSAQIKDEVLETKSHVTWFEKHYFHSIGGTVLADYYIPPAVKIYFVHETNQGIDSTLYYLRNWGFNLASVTYDARLNLYDFSERMSVSFNIPVAFGFGTTEPGGACSVAFPLLLDFNYGNHSTYNNIDRIGLHAGAGYDMMLTPLFKTDKYREIDQFWGTPMARIGVKGPWKDNNCLVDLQMSLPQKYYDDTEHQEFKQRIHFKIVIGFLLGYD